MKREAKLEEIIWKYLCAVIDLEDGKQLAQAIAQDEREMLEKAKADQRRECAEELEKDNSGVLSSKEKKLISKWKQDKTQEGGE